ncbi:hypothetical protein Ssed_0371 [Shewanella sediminis HAW-EB3]|uniref:Uncharacterized protein n=1 Tax=Shewanella sediminis (strain HAW-EB3) TaxID=425104 RepID=A8FQ61_SHESH|nr:hypothetical protein [Shewanella sediminis]ABV34984.1 hypothetical protein Ssed_0371 [Shewanella sediminis HAW-EB3]
MRSHLLALSVLPFAFSAIASSSLDALYGPIMPPAYIKAYEVNNHHQIALNPYLQVGNADNPIILDEGEGYVWVIDKDGNFVIAPEVTSPWGRKYKEGMMRIEDGKPKKWGYKEKYGHTALIGGSKARIGGELEMENGQWIMNNKSGRYNKRRPGRTEEAMHNAGDLLIAIAPQIAELDYEYLKDYGPAKPISLKVMKDIEWHYMIDDDYFWDAEGKKLGKAFVEKTPFIDWRAKVKFKEGFYMDTQDRFLKSQDEIFRVRLDVSKPRKSKFTHKLRSSDITDLKPMIDGEGEVDVSIGGDLYSLATDTGFNFLNFDFYNANSEEIFEYLMFADRRAYKQMTPLMRYGADKVLKTDIMRQSKYKGWLNTGPFAGHEIEIQIWKKIIEPGKFGKEGKYSEPLLLEIGFEGKTKNREELNKLNTWLYGKLKSADLLAKDQSQSKTEIAFAVSKRFDAKKTPKLPQVAPEVKIAAIDGIKTRNLDGTINVKTNGDKQVIAGQKGVQGEVYQTALNGKPLSVVVLGGKGNIKQALAKVVGAKGELLVAVAAGSSLDNPKSRAKLAAKLDGGNALKGYELLGDTARDYLKPIIKKNMDIKARSNQHYYWSGVAE